jgi:hypothetical protein
MGGERNEKRDLLGHHPRRKRKTKNFSFDKKINSFYANSDAAF